VLDLIDEHDFMIVPAPDDVMGIARDEDAGSFGHGASSCGGRRAGAGGYGVVG